MNGKGVSAIPKGYTTITPHLVVKGAAAAIDFYKKAFGAVEIMRMPSPDGKLGHAEIKIGDAHVFLADEFPGMGGCGPTMGSSSPVTIHMYVQDCDTTFNQAVAAGATPQMPPMDMFWGDRYGKLIDPFGHNWSIATHKEDVSPADLAKRSDEAFKQFAQQK